jgi:hypothetical protein
MEMELLYVVCQIAAADVCEEHRAALYGASSPIACITTAQAELPRLLLPGWKVARWSCDNADRTERLEAAAAVVVVE